MSYSEMQVVPPKLLYLAATMLLERTYEANEGVRIPDRNNFHLLVTSGISVGALQGH